MSEYERKAWKKLEKELQERLQKQSHVPKAVRVKAKAGGAVVKNAFDKIPLSNRATDVFGTAILGLKAGTFDPALHSIQRDRVLKHFKDRQPPVLKLEDLRRLDLKVLDDARPSLRVIYQLLAGAEGAAAAVAITETEVSATVSGAPGVALVVGAMAADAAATLAGTARVVAHNAAHYGYDTRQPEEELFALTAMNFGFAGAGETASKTFAFQQLSKLVQEMARKKAIKDLREDILVKVIARVFNELGFTLTRRNLSQAIPVLGIALGAGINIELIHRMAKDGEFAYRVRFLTEKYGCEPDDLLGDWYRGSHDEAAWSNARCCGRRLYREPGTQGPVGFGETSLSSMGSPAR